MTTRTRKEGGVIISDPWKISYTDNGGLAKQGTVTDVQSVREMTDEVIPNFKERSANGEIFNNPMSRTSFAQSWSAGQFTRSRLVFSSEKSGTYTVWGAEGTMYISGWRSYLSRNEKGIDVDRVKQLAVTKAYAERNNTDFSAFVALGEAKSTVEWFVSIFTRAISFYRNWKKKFSSAENLLKNSKGKAAKKAYGDLENLRMEYRYAVVPLAADMEGIANVLHGIKLSPRQTFRGFAADDVSETIPIRGKYIVDGTHFVNLDGYYTYSRKVECRAGVLTEVDFSVFNDFSRRMGFTQSVAAMYDLLPLSFILNWFINIGDFILAWQPNAGVSDLAAWCTVKNTYSQQLTLNGSSSYGQKPLSDVPAKTQTSRFSGQSFEALRVTVDRSPVTLASTAIRFDVNLDFFKILDLITIARNLVRT